MQEKLTIEDIAKKAGVGKATVSRVLNNTGYVSEKTRQKVNQIIEGCDYVPSATARNFVKQDSNMIGVIVPEAHNPYFASAVEGISSVLDQQELLLILCNSNKNFEKEERILRLLNQQSLKGLIITPTIDDMDQKQIGRYKERIRAMKTPVVFMDSGFDFYDWDLVYFDNRANAYHVTKAALEQGCKDIGILTGDLHIKTARDRYRGYLQALEEYAVPLNEAYVYQGDFTADVAYQITREMLASPSFPRTVFTTNNLSTIGFIKAVYDSGMVLGRDITCISFDKLDTFEELKYSYLERNPMEMGRMAATMLMERIQDPKLPTRRYYLQSKIKMNL